MRKTISSENAPKALGPYSQAVRAGDYVFLSGQVPINPETGKLVENSLDDEVRQVLKNLTAVMEAAGGTLKNIVKSTIFLTDMNDFAAVNKVYGEHFPENPPARACVQVSKLPLGARVEIEAVAYLG